MNDRLEHKLDKIFEAITVIKVDQAEIRKDLNYHIKRTDLLEEKLEPMYERFKTFQWIGGVLIVGIPLLIKFLGVY